MFYFQVLKNLTQSSENKKKKSAMNLLKVIMNQVFNLRERVGGGGNPKVAAHGTEKSVELAQHPTNGTHFKSKLSWQEGTKQVGVEVARCSLE